MIRDYSYIFRVVDELTILVSSYRRFMGLKT